MIGSLGTHIINEVKTLPFVDKYAGVVRTINYETTDKDGRKLRRSFPADCQTTFNDADCNSGRYLDLCPDDSKKSVMYLEDTGFRLVKREGHFQYFKANYDLIVWLNLPKLGASGCTYSAVAMAGVIKALPLQPQNYGLYHLTRIQPTGQKPKSVNPFAKYTYEESVTQFLLYPFDYFVLTLDVDFRIDLRCVTIESLNPPLNCVNR